jgi:hypothetical protein
MIDFANTAAFRALQGVAVLLLCVAAFQQAAAARIYNGAPLLEHPSLLPHREVKMNELWPTPGDATDYGIIDEAFVRRFVAALPDDRTYEFDLEGNPAREDLNLHLWHYDTNPETAVALRVRMMSIIDDERPDLDIGIWGIPHHVHTVQRDYRNKAKALAMIQREIEYQEVTRYSDTIYVSAYWRHRNPADFAKLAEWKKEVRLKVILAETFHGQKPRVYIWHRGYRLGQRFLDPAIFAEMLRFLDEEGLDIVFWASYKDPVFPEWVVQALEQYSEN